MVRERRVCCAGVLLARDVRWHESCARFGHAEALTGLLLTMFRSNNLALAWGDRIVAPLGITSARWQILGVIVQADRAQPVAWLARDLGANRQNVQRIINDLQRNALVSFAPNPHHKRAQLVVVTARRRQAHDAAIARYEPLVAALADGLPEDDIAAAQRILPTLRSRLEASAAG